MHFITGKPYIDLTPFLDIQGLLDIKKDIVLGIVKSKLSWVPTSADTSNLKNKVPPSLTSQCWPEKLKDPTHPDYEYFKALDFNYGDCLSYTKYMYKFQDMGEICSLRSWKNVKEIQHKFSQENCFDLPAYQHFPKLRNWIENCKAFDEIGRIMFVRNQSNQPGVVHKDTYLGSPDTFILFNLDPDRKTFFILDDDGKEIPVNCHAFTFDPRQWHGTRGLDYAGWTLRIDGVFNKEWLELTGLTEHYNQK